MQPPYPPHGPYGPHGSYGQPQYGQPQPYAPAHAYAAQGQQPLYRANVFVPPGAAGGGLVSPALRKIKLGVGVVQMLCLLAGSAVLVVAALEGSQGIQDGSAFAMAMALFMGWYVLLFVYGLTHAIWVYKFWSWIPPEQRYTSLWKKYISPGTAVGFLFIPYFNIYWMFVVYLGISDVLERMRVQYPSSKGPAKTLAILALVIPLIFFPLGPFLQYFFAKHVEGMANEMQARMPAANAAPAPTV